MAARSFANLDDALYLAGWRIVHMGTVGNVASLVLDLSDGRKLFLMVPQPDSIMGNLWLGQARPSSGPAPLGSVAVRFLAYSTDESLRQWLAMGAQQKHRQATA